MVALCDRRRRSCGGSDLKGCYRLDEGWLDYLAPGSPANLPSPEVRTHEFASQIYVERGMWSEGPSAVYLGATPGKPKAECVQEGNRITLSWAPVPGAFRYVAYAHRKSSRTIVALSVETRIWWQQDILSGVTTSKGYEMIRAGRGGADAIDMVAVTTVDRTGCESHMTVLEIVPASGSMTLGARRRARVGHRSGAGGSEPGPARRRRLRS
jgi:hypothetical protein